jgi:hypothetical protein
VTTTFDSDPGKTETVEAAPVDRRGSWLPTASMITTRIMELRRRRGLMAALIVVNIGLPAVFLLIRLLLHAFDPATYGPAGGYDAFTGIVTTLYVFGFIVAATLGCTAGSVDLTEGMFRHLVITGRSRLSLYFARIPAGLAIIVPMVAAGFTVVCAVCVFAAPTKLTYSGVNVPAGLSESGLQAWAAQHAEEVVCAFNSRNVNIQIPCYIQNGKVRIAPPRGVQQGNVGIGPASGSGAPGGATPLPSKAVMQSAAREIARQDYTDYRNTFLVPPDGLMVKTGLWIELEAVVGLIVGLGLASLIGQRTVPVVLLIILELVLTPLLSMHVIPHMINVQRGLIGLATARLEPSALPHVFGGGGPNHGPGASGLVPISATVAVIVIAAWLAGWTALGAWRMATRDA